MSDPRLLSDDQLVALRDYYLAQPNGQGDFEDIFNHLDALEARLVVCERVAEEAEGLEPFIRHTLGEEPVGAAFWPYDVESPRDVNPRCRRFLAALSALDTERDG